MAPEDIRSRVRELPFVPFRLHMSNGMSIDVHHPDMIAVADEALTVSVWDSGREKYAMHYYSVINVNVIEPLPDEPATEPNGQSKS